MDFYSVWPYFLTMGLIFLVVSTPVFRLADATPTQVNGRVENIDGLRGLLALGVFFHHSAIYHQYILNKQWILPPNRFYTDLGQSGVAMFFMVTGYLFWAKILRERGKFNIWKLYIGRVFRIIPLYLFLVLILLIFVAFITHWSLHEKGEAVLKESAKWLAGGVITGGEVNGDGDAPVIAARVTWSLYYEWMFYASLIITSVIARLYIMGILLPISGLFISAILLHIQPNSRLIACILMFSVGMVVATAKYFFAGKLIKFPHWLYTIGAVGCVAVVVFRFDGVYKTIPILILGTAFAFVVFGATLFGLLLTRPAKRLGDISYGIYLLQGPILFLAFASPPVRSFAIEHAWGHWLIVVLAALVLLLVANVTHALIERPGIDLGRWAWKQIAVIGARVAEAANATVEAP